MIDTHCHFDFPPFVDSPDQWLKRANIVGVKLLIVPGVSVDKWTAVQTLAETYPSVYFAVGLHPVWISSHHDDDIARLDVYLAHAPEKCIAIGECGLDFAMSDPQPERQIYFLRCQLALSEKYRLPVILHCRKAHNELLQILNDFPNVKGVLHAFSGSEELGLSYIKRDFLLGIGGTITYERASKTRNSVTALPLSSMVLETDAPDMPVFGYQGTANLPERLPLIAEVLSSLKNVDVSEIIQATSQNTRQLFAFNR